MKDKNKGLFYPKTKRFEEVDKKYIITEKLDGSNLGIGKLDGEIYIFQRRKAYPIEEASNDIKGLPSWAKENAESLKSNLREGKIVFGEWLGMGRLKYDTDKRYYLFAQGNLSKNDEGEFEISGLSNNTYTLIYAFDNVEIPKSVGVVPVVTRSDFITLTYLDSLYDNYVSKVGRDVEGFVIYDQSTRMVQKYVRYKNGKQTPHTTTNQTK